MRFSANTTRAGVLAIGLALGASTGVSTMAVAADSDKQAREAIYLEHVVTILRSQVQAMRMLMDNGDLKYADNMVRHAEAFERAFGMVGPMDWHVAKAVQKTQEGDAAEKLTEEQFDGLAEESYQKVLGIKRAARRYMRDKDRERMGNAINAMITSCGACHSKMPKGSVPSVWKGMKQ